MKSRSRKISRQRFFWDRGSGPLFQPELLLSFEIILSKIYLNRLILSFNLQLCLLNFPLRYSHSKLPQEKRHFVDFVLKIIPEPWYWAVLAWTLFPKEYSLFCILHFYTIFFYNTAEFCEEVFQYNWQKKKKM